MGTSLFLGDISKKNEKDRVFGLRMELPERKKKREKDGRSVKRCMELNDENLHLALRMGPGCASSTIT